MYSRGQSLRSIPTRACSAARDKWLNRLPVCQNKHFVDFLSLTQRVSPAVLFVEGAVRRTHFHSTAGYVPRSWSMLVRGTVAENGMFNSAHIRPKLESNVCERVVAHDDDGG